MPKWVVRDGGVWRVGSKAWRWFKANQRRLERVTHPRYVRMLDSIYVANIPLDAPAVLGYVGGKWPTYQDGSLEKRFPKALRMSCAVFAKLNAMALDIERYDANPSDAPAWVKRQHTFGRKQPVLYTSLSGAQGLVDLMTKAGYVYAKDYRLLTAHYTHKRHVCSSKCGYGFKVKAHGTQWTDAAKGLHDSKIDESWVLRKVFK